ncbi:hypothetical protein ALP8811_03266 [Aliiroseovarius pelagivivens]|uniref:Uncharacterized protein n=1 Tax=Aliiroseovarius pelagivivens TaxID=1639690 RepID=A0A2R8ATH2_9RHOB|nr:hypothetical protein ALP8811_03266 [Aliiroseovarius pelagivivens]
MQGGRDREGEAPPTQVPDFGGALPRMPGAHVSADFTRAESSCT